MADKKKGLLLLLSKKKPAVQEDDDEEPMGDLNSFAVDLIAGVKKDDPDAVADALHAAFLSFSDGE